MEEQNINQPKVLLEEKNLDIDLITNINSGIVYTKVSNLGKGGFGKCIKVLSSKDSNEYAMKIIKKYSDNKKCQIYKINKEINIHKDLQHQNVVKLVEYFEDDFNVYIVLELCSYGTLSKFLKSKKITINEDHIKYLFSKIIYGLKYIHSQKIIHRDLKNANILLSEKDFSPKICDFGLSMNYSDKHERKKICGTPNFMAPELIIKKNYSYPIDIWSLGIILYSMVYKRYPFEAETSADIYKQILEFEKLSLPESPKISSDLENLLHSMLNPNPKERIKLSKILCHDFLKLKIPRSISICDIQYNNLYNKVELYKHTNNELIYVMSNGIIGINNFNKKYIVINDKCFEITKTENNKMSLMPSEYIQDDIKKFRSYAISKSLLKTSYSLLDIVIVKNYIIDNNYIFFRLSNKTLFLLFCDGTSMLIDNKFVLYTAEDQKKIFLTLKEAYISRNTNIQKKIPYLEQALALLNSNDKSKFIT